MSLVPNQELKIEGEQPEVLEEDNLDLMLPTKKKKPKKVDFDEGELLEKDDSKNTSLDLCSSGESKEYACV